MKSTTKKVLAGLALGTATLGLSAGVATAGEITGNGKSLPVKGRSICAYSGLNDSPVAGDPFEGRTQNYGSIVKIVGVKAIGFTPGQACNPNAEPPPEPAA